VALSPSREGTISLLFPPPPFLFFLELRRVRFSPPPEKTDGYHPLLPPRANEGTSRPPPSLFSKESFSFFIFKRSFSFPWLSHSFFFPL